MGKEPLIYTFLLTLLLVFTGCAPELPTGFGRDMSTGFGPENITINIDRIDTLHLPHVKPLPIKIGVFYSDEFKNFKSVQDVNYLIKEAFYIEHIEIGKANIFLFEHIFSNLFKKVIQFENPLNFSNNHEDIDLFMIPSIYSFTYTVPLSENITTTAISYSLKIFTPDGIQITDWIIDGRSRTNSIFRDEKIIAEELIKSAMNSVALQITTGFCYQKDVYYIFYKQCFND